MIWPLTFSLWAERGAQIAGGASTCDWRLQLFGASATLISYLLISFVFLRVQISVAAQRNLEEVGGPSETARS